MKLYRKYRSDANCHFLPPSFCHSHFETSEGVLIVYSEMWWGYRSNWAKSSRRFAVKKVDCALSVPAAAVWKNVGSRIKQQQQSVHFLIISGIRPCYSILQSCRQAHEEGGGGATLGSFSSLLETLAAMKWLLQGLETSNTANESREGGDLCQNFFQPSLYLELHQDAIRNRSLSSLQILKKKKNPLFLHSSPKKKRQRKVFMDDLRKIISIK